ncbi:MAG TPA: hypothetical protein VEY68_02595 [Anoxybacillus sp.]|nr:hypothetical protein [Anoxybacillus sp.]
MGMFKKALFSWAKEMDKQRVKNYEKAKKRDYYIDVCVNHAEKLQDLVSNCENFTNDLEEQILDDLIPIDVKIEQYEKIVENIKFTKEMIQNNAKIYDLPSNAKEAYNDSIKHLLTAIDYYIGSYETKLELWKLKFIVANKVLTEDELEEIKSIFSKLPDADELFKRYIQYRHLQLDCYKRALEIIQRY